MTILRVLQVNPHELGKIPEWKWIINYAATAGTHKKLTTGEPAFNYIWLGPFYPRTVAYTFNRGAARARSLYGITDHLQVDPALSAYSADDPTRLQGDIADIRAFCSQARQAGIRVMADIVINHVAVDHPWAIKERLDIQAIRLWGKDIKVCVIQGDHTFECYPEQVYEDRGDFSIIGISYTPCGRTMPGTPREDGRAIYPLLFKYGLDFSQIVDHSLGQDWSDVVKINYKNKNAKELFVALWKNQIEWLLSMGISGFRCDAAYKIAPDIWSEIIQHSHTVCKEFGGFVPPVWLAETLGGTRHEIEFSIGGAHYFVDGIKYPGFDAGMLWTHWWDGKNVHYKADVNLLQSLTRFGGVGVPDNHDTDLTYAELVRKKLESIFNAAAGVDRVVATRSIHKAIEALLLGSSGICMQHGYLRCIGEQATVFDEPDVINARRDEFRARPSEHPLNIEVDYWHIVDYLASISQCGLIPRIEDADFGTPAGEGRRLFRYTLALYGVDGDMKIPERYVTVFINPDPESGGDYVELRHCLCLTPGPDGTLNSAAQLAAVVDRFAICVHN